MPIILLFCGLPGVGKTTLAKSVASKIGATILSSDKIRKELIRYPTYTRVEGRLIYDVLMLLTKYLTTAGVNCILDATFNRERSRKEVEKLCSNNVKLFLIECTCIEDVVLERLRNRKNDFSDADYSVYSKMKSIYEPVQESHLVIDTSLPRDANVQKILSYVFRKDYQMNI
ncbi:MAG TPA: AAA family ATPase [Nitrososphaeraceae archaeon]|jgi:predicted kinase|nr:AAA family ATPase [Nitrososphaeraceae archaeon]